MLVRPSEGDVCFWHLATKTIGAVMAANDPKQTLVAALSLAAHDPLV
jgi:hypothetical protein